jgi:capsule polysaccharide export protein KpsE/RkpR
VKHETLPAAIDTSAEAFEDGGPSIGLVELLTWIGEAKRLIAGATLGVALLAVIGSLLMNNVYTARTTLLPPASQQQSGSAAALAALGALGGLAGGLAPKTPDELYVALLKSDSVQRALIDKFDLRKRYDVETYEAMRKVLPTYIRVSADKKTGMIAVEVDDEDPKFAADLANAHLTEVTRVLGRLAVSDAQLRRVFFEQQLKQTKEDLVRAEQSLRAVQEKSGVIVLDKQAEALIGGAATLRAQIAEREVQLRVLRSTATPENPDVQRVANELRALRTELGRMESTSGGTPGSAVDMPVGKIPEAAIDYVRARRELKIQETLLEAMLRQYEIAKLDEAKEGPVLQQVDMALPPDRKSRPARALIVIAATFAALLLTTLWVVIRRYNRLVRETDPEAAGAWEAFRSAWRWRR